uniref:J domain-containing protein n=1 Tax=Thiohalocapsa sp. TaxID=2497641 RepID=UPI0025FABA89
MIPPLVELALDYYRNPLAYGHLADGSFPLPRGFGEQFSAMCSALSPLHIDATSRALDSSPDELEAAARFFARHVLLDPSADYYRALGVSPRATRTLIREHYHFLIKLFHPDRLPDATETDIACSRRLNAAYHTLSDPDQRTRYDREHPGRKRRIRRSDPRDFFGHHWVPLESAEALPRTRVVPTRWIWSTSVGVLGLMLLGAAVVLWEPQT